MILSLADKKLRLIQLIGEKLIQTIDTEQLADEILKIVVKQTKADRGFLCLFDKNGAHIPLASHGLKPGEKVRFSRTVLNRLMDEKSGVLIKQVSSYDDSAESLKAMKVESTLCVPLWTTDKIMCFISLDITGKNRSFTKSHLELLIAIAHQAAIGIERGRLAKKAAHEERVRAYLGQYLDGKIVQHITDSADGTDPLAPAEREVTILFSDIAAFTKISEGLKPIELANFIREYLTAMTEIIFAHGGTIDKYIGDAVMALFGAPIANPEAPAAAIRAALAMQSHIQKMKVPGDAAGHLRVRFGISTGMAVVGNLGSAQRVEYTSIGDSVNVAARLETFARPNEICVDEDTIKKAGDTFAVQEIGTIDVKNRFQPINVFKVTAEMVSPDSEIDALEYQALAKN